MTLRRFLNAGYALLVEAYSGLGVNLVEAMERASESIGMEKAENGQVEVRNDRSLAELEKMMRGVR